MYCKEDIESQHITKLFGKEEEEKKASVDSHGI